MSSQLPMFALPLSQAKAEKEWQKCLCIWRDGAPLQSLLFACCYFLTGLAGLELQSGQSGLTPVWPASGVAIAVMMRFGSQLWPGVVLGMLALAIYTGMPLYLGMVMGFIGVCEALLPLLLARRLGFLNRLDQLHDTLLFLSMAILGPLISATVGSVLMWSSGAATQPWLDIFLTWLLGNSIGFLVFGSVLFLVFQAFEGKRLFQKTPEIVLVAVLTTLISILSFSWMDSLNSVLMLNLLIPLALIAAVRHGPAGGLLPVFMALVLMMALSENFIIPVNLNHQLNILDVNIAQLWVVAMTGLLVSAAHQESRAGMRRDWQAMHDPLTGLYNRHRFKEFAQSLAYSQRRQDRQRCVLFVDLDRFKPVNDQYGHAVGDRVLVQIADVIRAHSREDDLAFRWGGDEFLLLLADCKASDAQQFAEKLQHQIRQLRIFTEQGAIGITASIGIAAITPNSTLAQVLDLADQAVYRAKNQGGNQIERLQVGQTGT